MRAEDAVPTIGQSLRLVPATLRVPIRIANFGPALPRPDLAGVPTADECKPLKSAPLLQPGVSGFSFMPCAAASASPVTPRSFSRFSLIVEQDESWLDALDVL